MIALCIPPSPFRKNWVLTDRIRKLISQFFHIVLFAAVLQASVLAVPSEKASVIQSKAPFLKINDYTVLYLNPVAPYLNAQGMLVAPVRILAALLGVGIKITPDGNTVTLSRKRQVVVEAVDQSIVQSIVFTVDGSTQVSVKPGDFPKPFRWHKTGEIMVPVEEVANAFGIYSEWNPEHQVFQMHDDDALVFQEDRIHGFPFGYFLPDAALSPVSFRVVGSSKPSGLNPAKDPTYKGMETAYNYRYQVVVRNGSISTLIDRSVLDVIDDDDPPDNREDTIGEPGARLGQDDAMKLPDITVRPGHVYHLTGAVNTFHSVDAVIIPCGAQMVQGHSRP